MELACPRCHSTNIYPDDDTVEFYGNPADRIRVMFECIDCGKTFDVGYSLALKEIEE